jgi:threonine/homoserine/homoserine lactone efflux protein
VSPEQWIGLALVFSLGAMSPGPSLAVVIRNTLAGGRQQGISTGIGHGLGFGVYAFLAAAGIATLLSLHDSTELILKIGGVVILLWLGIIFVNNATKGPSENEEESKHETQNRQGFAQGFLIALLNPKILAWMLALYTPFIETDTEIWTLLGMGLLGMGIDGTWYVTVATVLTTGNRVNKLRSISHIIDGAMGLLMFIFAGLLITGVL